MIARFRILLLALALCAGPASVCGAFPTAPIPHSATAKTARQTAASTSARATAPAMPRASTAQPPGALLSARATDTAAHPPAEQVASTTQPPAEHPSARTTDTAAHRTAARPELQRAPQVPPPDRAGAGGSRLPHLDGIRSADRRAQRLPRRDAAQDSINILSENNLRLYDSIEAKSRRRAVPRMLYQLLFRRSSIDTTASGRVIDESRLYAPYAGRTVGSIYVRRAQVFDPDGNWFERAGNNTHALTHERVVRRDLLFRTGDRVDPALLVRNKQLLRSRDYLSDAAIELIPDPQDTSVVHVVVRTRDSWTISADASFRGRGHTMFGVYDANILGTGNKLQLNTYFDRRDFGFGGCIVEYEIPNLLGTFYTADFSAGRNFYESELRVGLHKEFIRPTDYEVGAEYNRLKEERYFVDRDTTGLVRVEAIDTWVGRSRYLPSIASSIFLTGRYFRARHGRRPEVTPTHNPLFHDTDDLLVGLGLYREKFYSANLVHGFGIREYLAAGYRAELTGGYSWGEFDDRIYVGARIMGGGFTRPGYLSGSASVGSYIDPATGVWSRSAADIDLRWFSNLFIFRRNRIRQFLALNYTQGWNRGTGSDETVRFTTENGLRALREHLVGTNRAVLNTETVLFTPFQPLGFRFAFFGFADFGLLGDHANPFRNEFSASFGVGLRIRNERLIFHAIQIQLGIAVGKRGWLDSRYFRISNQPRMEDFRFLPQKPETAGFE